MIKIVIIIPEWLQEKNELTHEQYYELHDWFALTVFEIPFLPAVGMMIDLDDFIDYEKFDDVELGYVTIHQIIICRSDITLLCI